MIKVVEVTPSKWEIDLFSLDSLKKEGFQLSYSLIRARFQFSVCDGIQVSYYDWWATAVRRLFMPLSLDFLVLPVKKSDMSVKYKRQLNLTHQCTQNTLCFCSFFLFFFFTQNTLIFFVLMAIQGTQVSMYTKHTPFFFSFFGSTLGNAYFYLYK